jgi:pyridinium-3,5-biscarboxylic acid mononucleotide sulfurtransferase
LDRLAEVVALREEVVGAVRAAGYRYVTLDLEGLRSGNLNAALGLADDGAAASAH